jgi:hypothetical protein
VSLASTSLPICFKARNVCSSDAYCFILTMFVLYSGTVTEQKIIIEQEIRELRGKINNHLDKLQEDLLNELTEAESIVTRRTSALMVSLDEKQKELSEYKNLCIRYDFPRCKFCNRDIHAPYSIIVTFRYARCRTL